MSLRELWQKLTGAKPAQPWALTRPGQGEFERVAPYYDHLMRTVPYRQWVDYVQKLLRQHEASPRKVLDLCCGTGQVGVEMVQRGYEVIGIDLSEPMVKGCSQQNPPLPAAVMDARRLGLASGCLDLVVSLYDSLNYILEPAGLEGCFRGVNCALGPGGLFIFDLNTEHALRSGLFTQNNLDTTDPLQYSWKSYWNPETRLCRIDMRFRWDEGEQRVHFTEPHYERAHEETQVQQMLATAGFQEVSIYNAYTLNRPTRWSSRVYYVAQKPG